MRLNLADRGMIEVNRLNRDTDLRATGGGEITERWHHPRCLPSYIAPGT